ncbi:MAG: hypothetical protein ACP6IP_04940 [Candidatus Njordarchaeia archaeon]
MGILQRIMRPLIKREVIKASKEWHEKTKDWKKEEWRNYQAERFEYLKGNPWTSQVFPEIKKYTYETLLDYPATKDYPEFPEGFPAYRVVHTTGTTRRKFVKFTKEDAMLTAKAIGSIVIGQVGLGKIKNSLLIAGEEGYISAVATSILSFFTKKYLSLYANEFVDKLPLIYKKGPYDFFFAAQVIILSVLENMDRNIFVDDVIISHTGDVMFPSFMEYVKERLSEFGVSRVHFADGYGTSEIPVIAVSEDFLRDKINLAPVAETCVQIIEKEDGERVNLFDAKPGDKGRLLLTPLFSLMIPNYVIGDIVEVVGVDRRGIPTYKVLGRDLYKVRIKHPRLGVIEGYSGAMFKIFAVPVNTYSFDELMGKLKTRYLLLITKEGNRAVLNLYTEKPISKELLIKQMKINQGLFPLYEGITTGLIDVEVKKENLSYLEFFVENWRGGHLKVPKVLTDIKIIESPPRAREETAP